MPAVVKTLIQPRPVGKEKLKTSNIPFFEKKTQDDFSTRFQEDFRPIFSTKTEPVSQPAPAQVDHRDVRHIKEYQSENTGSYQRHPLPRITRIPRWTTLYTNFKMQKEPLDKPFLTTQSEKYPPKPFQHPPSPIRPRLAIKTIEQAETYPESTNKASFIRQHGSPCVRAEVKHLEGFPTIKGDGSLDSYVSHYNKIFKGAYNSAALPTDRHVSKVTIGDPGKIVERGTTHAVSFNWPYNCRPPVAKEQVKFNLGQFSKDSWSSTNREVFCNNKSEPVVLRKMDRNTSSLPKGDIDLMRNKDRMSLTTNRSSYPDLTNSERPLFVHRNDQMTKSNVKFSPPYASDLYYTTTAKEHYCKQHGQPGRPTSQRPSHILSGQEHKRNLSITKSDYIPLKTSMQSPCMSQQTSNLSFPVDRQYYSTTNKEEYTAKRMTSQPCGRSQHTTNFVMF